LMVCVGWLQLVSGYGSDTLMTLLVNNYDWFILPVFNPDGYEFSNTTVVDLFLSTNINQLFNWPINFCNHAVPVYAWWVGVVAFGVLRVVWTTSPGCTKCNSPNQNHAH